MRRESYSADDCCSDRCHVNVSTGCLGHIPMTRGYARLTFCKGTDSLTD
jgi:hypothetical protein